MNEQCSCLLLVLFVDQLLIMEDFKNKDLPFEPHKFTCVTKFCLQMATTCDGRGSHSGSIRKARNVIIDVKHSYLQRKSKMVYLCESHRRVNYRKLVSLLSTTLCHAILIYFPFWLFDLVHS